ncbi:DUF5677 domain-containing protein [Flavobacterium glaciei]|uniref:Uncharacterized protein n=4 Tax=Flavobacterium TaxID=237 RepID=A0A562PL73_9FLAO|nr:DUF5677 domain-containing protein [Flavobacterium glaciei]RDI51405.1 hypothetical protein DFR66_11318 [Flavobacterium glaciei]TWI45128.1 hypothetical protein IQ02_02320 [Flavobacterium glaciei]
MMKKKDFPLELGLKELFNLEDEKENTNSLNQIIKAYTEVIEAIYNDIPKLKEGEVFIETLSVKILITTKSIIELAKGYTLETERKISPIQFLDFSSINILTRAIIESFLTMEYLFYNNLSDEEKYFRFLIWRISGYKSRQNFFAEKDKDLIRNEIQEKLDTEINEINELLREAKKSKYFKGLDKNHLFKLDKYGVPRLESWNTLLNNSILKNEMFLIPYKLYSNYAHSEFISLIQLNGSDTLHKNSNDNKMHLKNALRIINMINCVSIIELKNKFECTLKTFNNLEESTKEKIEFWNHIATERYFHQQAL